MANEIIALIAAIVSAAGAYWAQQARNESRAANSAVNRNDKDSPRIYDLMLELIAWKRGYDGGPLDTGSKVDKFVGETNTRLEAIEKLCDQCPMREDCEQKEE